MDNPDDREAAALAAFLDALTGVRAALAPLDQALLDELVALGLGAGQPGDDVGGFAFVPPQTPATPPGVPIPYPNLARSRSYPWVRRVVQRFSA